jgi:hypothetical protein
MAARRRLRDDGRRRTCDRLYGLDRAFTCSERDELFVEGRNCRHLTGLAVPLQIEGPQLDETGLPFSAFTKLIQTHQDVLVGERPRLEWT